MAPFIPAPVFPPEITDSIIHELGAELPALRICSQVCRAWLPASRHILHQTLKLRGEDILGFMDIIASPENTYFATLRGLELSLCDNGPATVLLELLPKFVCLKSIGIYSSVFHYELPTLSSVTSLEFKRTEFRSFAAFIILLGQTPNLKSLKLTKVLWGPLPGWGPPATEDILPSKSIPRLELDVLHIEDRAFLDWFTSEVPAPLTSVLELFIREDNHQVPWGQASNIVDTKLLDKVSQYLQYLGVHLEQFYLRFSGSTQIQTLDVSTNTALRSLRINLSNAIPARNWTQYFSTTLPSLLERLRSDDIEELAVDINMILNDKNMNDKNIDLKRLSSILTSPRFARLRRLQFNGQWDGYAPRGRKSARKIFTDTVIDRLAIPSSCSIFLADPLKNEKHGSRVHHKLTR
ncbi:hypothetical protein B0H16DRAFT_1688201 [Mycena metata]|uniref:F-box domain-containing protein n=1 Tax=Mycena metata TaxID=1033252 RepID=A0AAD7JDW3_9AGAR|nr:hypothetical protein B0H16DRAFT_1688201 [Mycena metata]